LTSPGRLSGRAETGARGEQLVVTRLERDGYSIVARNWRCPVGELDIIASLGDLIVFVPALQRLAKPVSEFLEQTLHRGAKCWICVRIPPCPLFFDLLGNENGPNRVRRIAEIGTIEAVARFGMLQLLKGSMPPNSCIIGDF
jgi:putative endonuclease